jgi:ADP-ribose pyrophosphatase YjhB (NUDIX family)
MTQQYVGAYGLLVQNGAILVIRKMRGPYTGTFDLPGGGIEFGENPEDALRREFIEETGLWVTVGCRLPAFSHVAGDLHHLGFMYRVANTDPLATQIKTEPDGQDAGGALWLPLDAVAESPLSPLLQHGLRFV